MFVAVLVDEFSLGDCPQDEEREASVDGAGGSGPEDYSRRGDKDADENDDEIDSKGGAGEGEEITTDK